MKLTDYNFVYNAAAHFAASEKYPDGLIQAMVQNTAGGFDALCWALVELSAQGELVRRHMGHEKRDVLTADKVRAELMPYQIPEAKKIIMDAVVKGIQPPNDENAEVDEVLRDLKKKTGSD